jgi:hypothetical protein
VESSSLGNMGARERLNDPIETPTRSHDNLHERVHKEKGERLRIACVDPRDEWLMGAQTWMGALGPQKGVSQLSVGLPRGKTHPIDMMFHKSDSWSLYKIKGT